MKKILIADDESALRYLIMEILSIYDYELYEAQDGNEALKVSEEKDLDIILLDVSMPELNGYEVAKVLVKQPKRPVIIMMTARSQQIDKIKAVDAGVDFFVTKPFDPIELIELLEKI